VKNYTDDPAYADVNVDICVKLKKENRAFRVEKYEHSYPHCWRTDKPIIYYPLDAWFIRTTAVKEKRVGVNETFVCSLAAPELLAPPMAYFESNSDVIVESPPFQVVNPEVAAVTVNIRVTGAAAS
jgi:valyl-tRNA synthetase